MSWQFVITFKVLVIDDDPSVCKTVGLLLEDHGYSPRTFTDPQEALATARRNRSRSP